MMWHEGVEGGRLGQQLGLAWVLPFVLLLLAIAVLPLIAPRWWRSNVNKGLVSLACGLPVLLPLWRLDRHRVLDTAIDYVAFIALLGALFVIAGGIYVRGAMKGSALANTLLLGTGATLANVVGTTGASMLLIRPILRANEERRHQVHIVIFFIFIVSNIGGLLTPLGDPPLFLGFLRGVPFEWTLRLLPVWLCMNLPLLAIFYVWDRWRFGKERQTSVAARADHTGVSEPLAVEGAVNLALLAGVMAVAFLIGRHGEAIGLVSDTSRKWAQAAAMALLGSLSVLLTPPETRAANRFTFHPIVEVAVVFAGIFATMIPALAILEARGAALGIVQPWQFFWVTGALSSILDNAPTYLTFAAAASGLMGTDATRLNELLYVSREGIRGEALLRAISAGAVLMGANTYIGNGPNFMVKAIAEEAGVAMPSFFGYVKYSIGILCPLFVLLTLAFFRP